MGESSGLTLLIIALEVGQLTVLVAAFVLLRSAAQWQRAPVMRDLERLRIRIDGLYQALQAAFESIPDAHLRATLQRALRSSPADPIPSSGSPTA